MQPDLPGVQRFYPPPLGRPKTASLLAAPPWLTAPADSKYTVIYPPTINYDYMKQRPQHLMDQFAADGLRVYYLNIWERQAPPQEVRPNLFVVHRAGDIHGLPRSHPVVLWMTWSESIRWIDRIHPDISVYDCLDDFPEWAPAERLILPRADLVTATSDALFHKMREQHQRVILVRNACEYERSTRGPSSSSHVRLRGATATARGASGTSCSLMPKSAGGTSRRKRLGGL